LAGSYAHQSVLLEEVAGVLAGCSRVLDGTVGGGGHAERLLEAGSRVLGLDKDPHAVAAARERLSPGARILRLDFRDAAREAEVRGFAPDGVLLDLGVSSPQLDDAARGFTFRTGAALDMRTDPEAAMTAAQWLNHAPRHQLAAALAEGADEPRARALAGEIVRRRARSPFATSEDLVNAIRAVKGKGSGPADFARVFQAVRIAVNDELGRLSGALPELLELLAPGGVLAVISYHSGEDRIVKRLLRDWARRCVCPAGQPVCTCRGRPLGTLLTRRAIRPSEEEVAANPRARSARLRAFRKAAP
jgi:16S rRNA (cytosine1402-N4)-methyltransferase